jgi:transposase, IS5 family
MFKATSKKYERSFLGSYLFEKLVPENHPLRLLSQIADFSQMDEDLKFLYSERGQKAYSPAMMIRVSILKDLYNVSDERVIQMIKENIPARMYAGISLESKVPDPSDLTYFRRRLGEDNFQKVFDEVINIAKQNGLKLGDILLIDSTHSQAKIDQHTQGRTRDKKHNDPDAKFAHKSPSKTFFGFKHHTGTENNHNLIMAVQTTPGDTHDGKKFKDIVDESLLKNPDAEIIAADKAYDDIENHEYVENQDIFSAIALKEARLRTRNKEFKYWDASGGDNRYFKQYFDPRYAQGQKQRYKAEQPYAEMKNYHGLRRSRYLGLEKNHVQGLLTAAAYNLKHILTFINNNATCRKLNHAFIT